MSTSWGRSEPFISSARTRANHSSGSSSRARVPERSSMAALNASQLISSTPSGWWGARSDAIQTGRHRFSSVLDLIGNTPTVDLGVLSRQDKVGLFGKLEAANPGGSIKDRPALQMLADAMTDGI